MADHIEDMASLAEEFAKHLSEQIDVVRGRPHDQLSRVVTALGLRSIRLQRSICLLDAARFSEEVEALSRVLVETVVNAAYLLAADEAELRAYTGHSLISLQKHQKAYVKHVGNAHLIPSNVLDLLDEMAAKAKTTSGRTEKDTSWTGKSVMDRARKVEEIYGETMLTDFAATIYTDGHAYIHSTFSSLGNFFTGDASDPHEVLTSRIVALNGVLGSLLSLMIIFDKHFKTGKESELKAALGKYAKLPI